MAKLKVIYRSKTHAPFWIVAEKSGMWEKNGLEVDSSPLLIREKAVEALKNGHVDVISGNHHNLYVRNAKNGEDFVHLAQATNNWNENKMIVANGIQSVKELKGKRVAIDKLSGHTGLNVWLFLRQEGLDLDKGEVELVDSLESPEERWKAVLKGDFAATFIGIPHNIRAARAGARVIEVRRMPMIRGVTLTTTMSFVNSHEDEIRRLIRGMVEAIHFFLTKKEETLKILKRDIPSILKLDNDGEMEAIYNEWVESLGRCPYPSPEAINNVFQLALRGNPEIADFDPMALWNTRYLRELDDSGYIDSLYK